MGCSSCSSGSGSPSGCGNKGHCSSGSCNKMNTYDWLTTLDIEDPDDFPMAEVSFKKGARKAFYFNPSYSRAITGDMVVVESTNGFDIGRISLSGNLVRLQMKKKNVSEERIIHKVIRRANQRDLEKLADARKKEYNSLVKSRKIVRTLDLKMKIGDVEYQGDLRKVTFYYTADGRVDFRELIRMYAKEFKTKIEMRQIGSRQESGRIGGIGSCGRELCCSTWLSDFSTVTTSAARYQNLAINQTKLSGQCGRLKCCLNFELDMYVEALDSYPSHVQIIKTKVGTAKLIKTDIFAKRMFYITHNENGRSNIVALSKEQVLEYREMNDKGKYPEVLISNSIVNMEKDDEEATMFGDLTGVIELPEEKKSRRRKKRPPRGKNSNQNSRGPRNKNSKGGNNQQNNKNRKPNKPNNKSNDNNPKKNNDKNKNSKPNNNQEGSNKDGNVKNSNPRKNNNRNRNRNRNQNNENKGENKSDNKNNNSQDNK